MVVDSDVGIDACWSQCALGDLSFAIADSPRARIARWHSQTPIASSGRVLVHLQNVGHSVTSQRFRDAALNAGDLTFCLPDEPYELRLSDRNQMIVLNLSIGKLAEILPDWEMAVGQVISTGAIGSPLLRNFISSIRRHCWQADPHPVEAQALSDVVWQLLRLALIARPIKPIEKRHDVAALVTEFVERHLTDPDITTSSIARSLSLSPRTVQNVFAAMGTTPTEFILTRRLNRAAEILASGTDFGSITDLALDLGFNDSAYFARRFKGRFGITPTMFRASRSH
jgi:AraC-like DNA-binding protein